MFKKSKGFTQFKKAMLIVALVAFLFEPLALAMPTEAWAGPLEVVYISIQPEHLNDDPAATDPLKGGTALGAGARAHNDAVAVGYYTRAAVNAVASGYKAHAYTDSSIATGAYANAIGDGSIATGSSAQTIGRFSIATGFYANATGNDSVAAGSKSTVTGDRAIAIGARSNAAGYASMATGYLANASGDGSIATGYLTNASGGSSIATGNSAQATGECSIATGYAAQAAGKNSIATGSVAQATSEFAIATGWGANASGGSSIATGYGAKATGLDSIATGSNAQATGGASIATGYSAQATGNKSIATGERATATGLGTIAIGPFAQATSESAIATGYCANATGFGAIATGTSAQAIGNKSIATGNQAKAIGISSIAIGEGAEATENSSVAVGAGATATAVESIATGFGAVASGQGAVASGYNAKASGLASIAAGVHAEAGGEHSAAVGYNAQATAVSSAAFGDSSLASGNYSVALGYQAQAKQNNSVAIGSNSVTRFENEVSVGNSTLKRKITNVAPGEISETSTDAVNGSQLYGTNVSIVNLGLALNNSINTTNIKFGDINTKLGDINTNIGDINVKLGDINTKIGDIDISITGMNDGKADKTDALKKIDISSTGNVTQTTVAGSTSNVGQLIDTAVRNITLDNNTKKLTVTYENKYTKEDAGETVLDVQALMNTKVNIQGSMGNISTSNGIVSTKTERTDEKTGLKVVDVDMKIGESFTITDPLTQNYTSYTTNGLLVSNPGHTKYSVFNNTLVGFQEGSNSAGLSIDGLSFNGKTYVSSTGLNANSQKITNVAPGEISATSTDAVNGSQLYGTNQNIINLGVALNNSINTTNIRFGDINTKLGDINTDLGDINVKIVGITENISGINVQLGDINTQIENVNMSMNNMYNTKADTTIALGDVTISNTGILSQTTISGSVLNVAQLFDSTINNMYITKDESTKNVYLNLGIMNNYTGIEYDTKQLNITELINSKVEIKGSLGNISTSNGIVSTKTERTDPATGLKVVDIDMKIGEDFTLTNKLTNNYTNYTTNGIFVSNSANTIQSTFNNNLIAFKEGDNTASLSVGGLTFNGKTYVSNTGINANNQKITYVAPGEISETSTDAVNGSQLYGVEKQVELNVLNIQNNTTRLNNTYTKPEVRSMVSTGNVRAVTYDDTTYKKVTLSGDGGTTITNVKAGAISVNSTDAVNGSQLYETNIQLAATNKEVQEVGAMSAALAGLHYMEPTGEGDDKVTGAVSYGGYRGQNAAAVGLAYKPNQNMMFTASTSIGTTQQSYNAGMSFKFGKGKTVNRAEMAKQIKYLGEENNKLKSTVEAQGKENAELKETVKVLLERMEKLEKKVK